MTRIHVILKQISSIVAPVTNLTFVGPENVKNIILLLFLVMSTLVVPQIPETLEAFTTVLASEGGIYSMYALMD